ncbi:IclR family transcriptional regulator [Schleiferilactobacillus harbinensis]|jgi:DNA-binding IclR family transcriptional regulator|uniref:Helix-turn-helix domain-containing protein n=1 Tax=Schleiferilactobacillus harbinensis TaxID=304207 RepID=A0A510TZC5_9LACO|nr:IclR family transcriptional regulator [Schleiferilactobacillus harbinensis]MBO3091629.1 IclR family transcriptional regulator [Schleiferilactobacillus harbinensis]QEU48357.1 IclR family transcriptional regulator [Schleiferilactobacillus harbinensis]QFR22196.1 helix-turn-helix domain-containing protein [Schleiferilactobacillus harbinensis]GEK06850.1 transcriptional regulator [Schleiferilactobacillus harbinensis]
MPETTEKLYGTVLIKAKEIMDFTLAADEAPTLMTISRGTGLTKPTALKILTTLCALGFMHRDDESRRYYLGTQFIPYATKAMSSFNIRDVAFPALEALRQTTGETINLGVLESNQVMLIEKLESPNSIKLKSTIGGRMHLYSSAMGKAILATFTPDQLAAYLHRTTLQPVTPHTLITPTALKHNIQEIKDRGVAIDNEENELEVFCVGATIYRHHRLFGAFSVSAPKYRVPEAARAELIDQVRATQEAITAEI